MSELRIPSSELKADAAFHADGGPFGVCVVRIADEFYAVADRCSHAKVALSAGDVDPEERTVECWKHGSTFSLLDGQPQSLPATAPVAVYAVRVDGDDIVVELP